MRRLLALFASCAALAGCVMLTEDGRTVHLEDGRALLMDFRSRLPGLGTETGQFIVTQAGQRLIPEVGTPILLAAENGLTLITESNIPLEI